MRGPQTERLESVLRYSSARKIVKLRSSYRCVVAHWLPSMPFRHRLCVPCDACSMSHVNWMSVSSCAKYIVVPNNIHSWMANTPACRLGLRRTA